MRTWHILLVSGSPQFPETMYVRASGPLLNDQLSSIKGHNGTRGFAFYNNPDVVADFAYRS